jgi:hypothetical protein
LKTKHIVTTFIVLLSLVALVVGVSLFLQPGQSTLSIILIIGAAILGVSGFISGFNDTYDLIGKLTGSKGQDTGQESGEAFANQNSAKFTLDLYVSFSKRDEQQAKLITDILRANRVTLWYAARSNVVRTELLQATRQAILECRLVVIILSANYLEDTYLHSDLSGAISNEKPIIVYALENVDYPSVLDESMSKGKPMKPKSVIPIDAWKSTPVDSYETLKKVVDIFLGKTEEEKKFQDSLKIDHFSN